VYVPTYSEVLPLRKSDLHQSGSAFQKFPYLKQNLEGIPAGIESIPSQQVYSPENQTFPVANIIRPGTQYACKKGGIRAFSSSLCCSGDALPATLCKECRGIGGRELYASSTTERQAVASGFPVIARLTT
jgi:hypothetical protein